VQKRKKERGSELWIVDLEKWGGWGGGAQPKLRIVAGNKADPSVALVAMEDKKVES